jgi:pimeloyl-ACP methyl ester carboxylesterase
MLVANNDVWRQPLIRSVALGALIIAVLAYTPAPAMAAQGPDATTKPNTISIPNLEASHQERKMLRFTEHGFRANEANGLFIHGWNQKPRDMEVKTFLNTMQRLYKNVAVYQYPSAEHIQANAEALRAFFGNLDRNLKFDIVAYSEGGLVARYLIEQLGLGEHVENLLTIATPHRGFSHWWCPAIQDGISDMQEWSGFLQKINLGPIRHDHTLYFAVAGRVTSSGWDGFSSRDLSTGDGVVTIDSALARYKRSKQEMVDTLQMENRSAVFNFNHVDAWKCRDVRDYLPKCLGLFLRLRIKHNPPPSPQISIEWVVESRDSPFTQYEFEVHGAGINDSHTKSPPRETKTFSPTGQFVYTYGYQQQAAGASVRSGRLAISIRIKNSAGANRQEDFSIDLE